MPVLFPPHKWYHGPELKMVDTTNSKVMSLVYLFSSTKSIIKTNDIRITVETSTTPWQINTYPHSIG
jgi:hypothetical protein